MKEFIIEMFPASYGDSFLVSCGEEKAWAHILIDTGFSSTYEGYIKERLKQLHKEKERLALFVMTHIDADHIEGSLGLFRDNGNADDPQVIGIDEVWHNSLRNLLQMKQSTEDMETKHRKILEGLIRQGLPREVRKQVNAGQDISARQSALLSVSLMENRYNWNHRFGGRAVTSDSPVIKLDGGVEVVILSPDEECLKELEKAFFADLRSRGVKSVLTDELLYDGAFEVIMSRLQEGLELNPGSNISYSPKEFHELVNIPFVEDNSKTNGSSISFILSFDGRQVLFLGDSHPSVVERKLRSILRGGETRYYFDAVKISHHGSKKNTSPELLELIDSPKYIISTNGEHPTHQHPDVETLARIVCRDTSKQVSKRTLIFNYRTDAVDQIDKPELKEKFHFEVDVPEKEEIKRVVL